ncbi:hypothetical protein BB381_06030 [Campylobacter pinnipediorum subsp. caledonicus]|uniref:TetR/AcrR family transcriptional regulator n=1 Tax=Campylobacter pinnipediorum TaxID=1965231 RepID=UPI000995A045|nr:TetR/AcrR family transcriptional regulator [Campylobacter pinnipediorum]OPA72443.1 hypothetical protein BB381_06030 [Campylobacter pinnipediorum subsp. caledonicus]
MTTKKRSEIKRNRMMHYFINAANQIIQKDGINSVNIRNTAHLAGYSSATLYNYFDNLTHLVFLATFNQLEEYNQAMYHCILNSKNSIEVYMNVCKCFCEYSYEKPEIYEMLFFSHNDDKFNNYIKEYYTLFPDKNKNKIPDFLNRMLNSNNLHSRSLSMLENCIKDGFINKEEVSDFNDICLRFNKTILQDVKEKILSKKEATNITLRYYYKLFRFYIKQEHAHLLDECYYNINL